MEERKYVAVSIKHSHSYEDLWLWGNRTKDHEKRCFAGYSNFFNKDGTKCELYSIEEFRKKMGNGVCKTDEVVHMTKDILRKYQNYDTVLVDEKEYMSFFGIKQN